jgi:hypothetical protein
VNIKSEEQVLKHYETTSYISSIQLSVSIFPSILQSPSLLDIKMKFAATIFGAALLTQQSIAHPGQSKAEAAQEIAERAAYFKTHRRTLADCADILKARGNDIAMHQRRTTQVEKLRAERAISQGMLKTATFSCVEFENN